MIELVLISAEQRDKSVTLWAIPRDGVIFPPCSLVITAECWDETTTGASFVDACLKAGSLKSLVSHFASGRWNHLEHRGTVRINPRPMHSIEHQPTTPQPASS